MTAYISVSYSKRKLIDKELNAITDTLNKFKIVPFIFVDNYKFDLTQERQMMQQAMKDIDNCSILIAETTDKGIGIGIEVGYAKAKNKPVIYVRQKNAEHSTTVSGISDFQIIYEDNNDLQKKLSETINKIVMVSN
ncbi:MAG: nucleoside 2-deoxyribosyltransferase [Sphingobacteriales bacterium]